MHHDPEPGSHDVIDEEVEGGVEDLAEKDEGPQCDVEVVVTTFQADLLPHEAGQLHQQCRGQAQHEQHGRGHQRAGQGHLPRGHGPVLGFLRLGVARCC